MSDYHHTEEAMRIIFDKLVWLSPEDRRKLARHLSGDLGADNARLRAALEAAPDAHKHFIGGDVDGYEYLTWFDGPRAEALK